MKNELTVSANAREVNFRAIRGGAIAPQLLYCSSHSIQQNRQEPVIALLAGSVRIAAVINLADTDHTLAGKALFAPWYNRLLHSGRVIAPGMDFSNTGENFRKKLKKAL